MDSSTQISPQKSSDAVESENTGAEPILSQVCTLDAIWLLYLRFHQIDGVPTVSADSYKTRPAF